MATINLLPWREERRQLLKRQFLVVLAGVAVVGLAVVLATHRYYSAELDYQETRNDHLQSHITELDRRVREIRELQERRSDLLERMRVIQDLQGQRPVIVRVFDELVRTLPDGVFYESLRRQGETINAEGVAESNQRVSSLMRRLDGSDWFADPNLTGVSAVPTFGEQASRFRLAFSISTPNLDAEEE